MSALPGVSIIIPNFNYARFVGEAIESALAQDHPMVEVIVVDDGSTDDSRQVISAYQDRVRILLQGTNAGQCAALNSAWPLAQHPILMFLDSDDVLMPHAASVVAKAWAPQTAKVQFPLASTDVAGRPLGHVAPEYPSLLDTLRIRNELLQTGSAPASQGSGNAYARWLLDNINQDGGFVIPVKLRMDMDCVLEINAPFYGDVTTLLEPLVYYRVHSDSVSRHDNMTVARFNSATEHLERKIAYLEHCCQKWNIMFDLRQVTEQCLILIEYRIAAKKLSSRESLSEVSPERLLWPALRACAKSPLSTRHKLCRWSWLIFTCLLPTKLAQQLIRLRFVIASRPSWLKNLIGHRPLIEYPQTTRR